jgi:hypothetical protein
VLLILFGLFSNVYSQEPSAACVSCGRSASYIQKYGHAPTCKYYNAPKKTSGNSSRNKSSSNDPVEALNKSLELINSFDSKPESAPADKNTEQLENQRKEEDERYEETFRSFKKMPGSTVPKRDNNYKIKVSFEVQGNVTFYSRDGQKITPESMNAVTLDMGCRIVTGKDSKIKIILPDNTIFSMGPESDFEFDEFIYDPEINLMKITANLAAGFFRWVTYKTTKDKENKHIRLRVLDVGIRGTDFAVKVEADKSVVVYLYEGEIEVETLGSKEKIILNPGKKAVISSEGKLKSFEGFNIDSNRLLLDNMLH